MARRLQILTVGKVRALAGLSWRDTPGETAQAVREQVRSAAEAYRSRFGVLVENTRAEVGMVPELSQREGKSGVSAAAWLATAHEHPLLYVEELPQSLYWVVHVESGYVDPRTDQVCGEEEARGLIDSLLESQGLGDGAVWRVVINAERKPSSVMLDRVPDIEQVPFTTLVSSATPPPASTRVRQLVGVTPGAIVGVVAVLALAAMAWGGYVIYEKHEQQRRFEEQRAALAAKEAEALQIKNEAELRMKVAVDLAAQQDTATVEPQALLDHCAARLDQLGGRVGGWKVLSADCPIDGNTVVVTLQAPEGNSRVGTALTLEIEARARGVTVDIDPASRRATLTAPLTAPPVREGLKVAGMPRRHDTVIGVLSRIQWAETGAPITVAMTPPTPRPVVYVDPEMESHNDASRFKPVPPDKTFLQGTLKVSGTARWSVDAASFDYPFVSITKLLIIPSDSGYQWQMEASYVCNG